MIDDSLVKYRVLGKHILLYKSERNPKSIATQSDETYIHLSGRILDRENSSPLAFATVGIPSIALGTVSNQDGVFTLRLPKTFEDSSILISHIGYEPQLVPAAMLTEKNHPIYLQPKYIPIQEIVVRNLDARATVGTAIERKNHNYFQQNFQITAFYREGVTRNHTLLSYSEAVVKIFKTAYNLGTDFDQVKLIRFRKMEQANRTDTLEVKLQAGINGTLDLDIVKNLPDFLDPQYNDYYNYHRNDIVSIDGKSVYVIAFEQKPGVTSPLFSGLLYINTENLAIIAAEFEINPKWVEKTASQLVVRRDRGIRVTPQRVKYWIRYQEHNQQHYVKHIRGEIDIRVRTRYWPIPNSYNLFFECVGLQVDTLNVERFARSETLKPNIVFADSNFEYDSDFWMDMNYIEPEENLLKALSRITPKIEKLTEN